MQSGSLYRVVYMSTAVGVLRAEELDRIYLRAKSGNAGAGITGLMLFYEGVFLQVLEGPAAGVMSLMEKIRRDRRHSGIAMLEAGPVDARAFEGSAMHFVAARNLSPGEKQAFSDLRKAVAVRPAMAGEHGLSDLLAAFASVRPA
jgi:hypothetical protein